MNKSFIIAFALVFALAGKAEAKKTKQQMFPDGTPVPEWFNDTAKVDVQQLGKQYVITDYGVSTDPCVVQTKAIQAVIDRAANEGGGVVVVPRGTFLTGSLFFHKGTHLHVVEGGRIKGSDAIANYDIVKTRLEGQTIKPK